jgi:hypothetical protein
MLLATYTLWRMLRFVHSVNTSVFANFAIELRV